MLEFLNNSKDMDDQAPLEFKEWARRYRGMGGVAIPNTPEGNRQLFKLREDYGAYVKGMEPIPYVTLTNKADNSEIKGVIEDGKFRHIPNQNITTPSGTYAMKTWTNAVAIPQPKDPSIGNYLTTDPSMGAPAPGIGGAGMAVTNAPTAAPNPTPAPTPAPSFVVEATSDEIRQRYPNAPANLVPGMTIRLKSGGAIVVK